MENELQPSDWPKLVRLRDHFLNDPKSNYWRDRRDLEVYHAVFAERIGWKWDAVIGSMDELGWKPSARRILDWGCGTAIASSKIAAWTGIREVSVFDQSSEAMRFSQERLLETGCQAATRSSFQPIEPGTLLLLSHVLNETPAFESALLGAEEVLWVEPGTYEISRKLGAWRDRLLSANFNVIAPCTHAQRCPMFDPENARDWCHFFAEPPNWIFHSAFWREINLRLKIDLRSLPYSYLALSKKPFPVGANDRVIGRPVVQKAHCELLCCGEGKLKQREIRRRDQPELFRALKKGELPSILSTG